jgi:hypothetical protein
MNEASGINDGAPLAFHLTGGEPFLHFPLLVEIVAYGASLSADVSCVTNAFWAKTLKVATEKLASLKSAGLTSLAVSVSRFHEDFVPRRNAGIALAAASALNLPTELKGAVTMSDLQKDGLLETWKREFDADEINITPVIPGLRDGTVLAESEYYRKPGLPRQKCPGAIVCVEANGGVMSCCGQSPQTGFLAVGNIYADSLAILQGRFLNSGKQTILREQGPIAFAEHAISSGFKHLLRKGYAGPCDLCVHIGTDPELRRIAEEMSAAYGSSSKQTKTVADLTPIQRPLDQNSTLALLARRLHMSKNELEQLKDVLTEAASNSEFRTLLLANPEEASKQFLGFEPSADFLKRLISLTSDIRSVGEQATLQHAEAQNWAIGLIVMSITSSLKKDWKVAIADIPRLNKKKKKKHFGVRIDDIPRLKKTVGAHIKNIPSIKSKRTAKAKRAGKPVAKPK